MIDASLVIQILSTALVTLALWIIRDFRTETRKSIHDLRGSLQPVITDVAVLKAVQAERAQHRDDISKAVENALAADRHTA